MFWFNVKDADSSLRHKKIVTYADDTVIFTSYNDMNIIISKLNHDTKSFTTLFCNQDLIMNDLEKWFSQ